MRILQINSTPSRGSTGRIVSDIAAAARARGHEAFVAFGRGTAPAAAPADHWRRFNGGLDLAFHGAMTRVFDSHGLWSRRSTKDLSEWLFSIKPDVVHLHNIHGYYLNYEILFDTLARAGVPWLWTLHDAWPMTGHCAYFTAADCDRWQTQCHDCPQQRLYPASYVLDRSTRNHLRKNAAFDPERQGSGMIVTPSRWLAGVVGQSALSGYPTRVINNDPDYSVFKPRPSSWRASHGLERSYLLLAIASIWEPRKGLSHLLDLSTMLSDDERLVVVGKLPPGARLPDDVLHIPRTESAIALAEIYSACDVLLNPTLEDNYPTVNLEALACGTPVITFDTGGSPEALERGPGLITDTPDSNGLRNAIDRIRAGELVCVGGDHGLIRVEGDGMAVEYLRLYTEITSN